MKSRPTVPVLWPPNHKLVSVGIVGVSDDNDAGVRITITGVPTLCREDVHP